jgi:hypothetical protein
LNTHFPDKKYPLIKTLRAELSELYEEKKRLYPEYYAAKDEFRNIDTMKSNVDSIIRTPPVTQIKDLERVPGTLRLAASGKNPHEHEQERSRNKKKDELE